MRRDAVVAAMLAGELPYEQRGRIRYVRITGVYAWDESRSAYLSWGYPTFLVLIPHDTMSRSGSCVVPYRKIVVGDFEKM
jgi:hypothetical protein